MKKEKRVYCVYKHASPKGKIYIGITSQKPERRWQNGYGYASNLHFFNAIKKYGWDNFKHEILENNLTYEEASAKEIYYIKKYNSSNSEYGYNISKGGDGGNATPVKMYSINGDLIDTFNSIAEASNANNIFDGSISNAINGLSKTAGGYLWTKIDDVLDKKSILHFTDLELVKFNKAKIKQYDLNGNFLKMYDSLEAISKICGIPPSSIYKVCIGKLNATHNYVWRFENDNFDKYFDEFKIISDKGDHLRICNLSNRKYSNIPIYQYNFDGTLNAVYKDIYCIVQPNEWQYSHIIACLNHIEDSCDGYVYRYERDLEFEKTGYHRKCNTLKVNQFDLHGKLIKTYNSIAEAEKSTGATNISMCIHGYRHKSGNYVWRYVGDDFNKYPLEPKKKSRHILQYTTNGEFIKEYSSIREAERLLGITNISKCLRKICKTIGGYVWRYKEDKLYSIVT